ncbi:hypothetical protein PC9H_000310 [Pleurotus ostreatus]|uniref:Uncharacterized protein n=1 Tax=Pleurotus ostreatus TaxID=5322 RepID=A0A8H7DXP5_PLEOS|nr:uncharacterized protein PC9H_000310 [Pleurotus ostreatus]KAF7439973.1 hypothetical protein PC9H_000310 [Pleurotus ostreatus]KAJ8700818.1 hypothetical protein PTI98_003808 [Pleurotus ostreatus]
MSADNTSVPIIVNTPEELAHPQPSKYQLLHEFLNRLEAQTLAEAMNEKPIRPFFGPRVSYDANSMPFPSQPSWEPQSHDIYLENGIQCGLLQAEAPAKRSEIGCKLLVGSWFAFATLLFLTAIFAGAEGQTIRLFS